jgi:hypothetical protein
MIHIVMFTYVNDISTKGYTNGDNKQKINKQLQIWNGSTDLKIETMTCSWSPSRVHVITLLGLGGQSTTKRMYKNYKQK